MSYSEYMIAPPHAVNITPDDSSDLVQPVYAITARTAGEIRVETVGGDDVIIPINMNQFVLQIKKVYATDTSATGIVGFHFV